MTSCDHELTNNTCRFLNCGCSHYHIAVTSEEYTHIYYEDIKFARKDGNIVWYPYDLYGNRETHLHTELTMGSYTHIYCECINTTYRDGKIVWFPYELYF